MHSIAKRHIRFFLISGDVAFIVATRRFSMRYRLVVALIVMAGLIPISAFSQAKALRTPDGQPDLQGIWSFATITPFERPAELAGKEFFTPKEAADYEQEILKRNNMDRRDGPAETDVRRAYNDFWWDRGTRIVKTRRTSLIIDPPDGRIPRLLRPRKKHKRNRKTPILGMESNDPRNLLCKHG